MLCRYLSARLDPVTANVQRQGQKGSTGSHHIGFVIGLGTEIRVMGLGLGFSLGQDKGSDVVWCDPVDPFDSLSLCILQ